MREDEKETGSYIIDVSKYKTAHPTFTTEIALLEGLSEEELTITGVVSIRKTNIFTSSLSLGRTVFVCFVLTCGAIYFSKDANDLALGPIERMIVKVFF